MVCFRFVCVHNSWSSLKLNGDVYVDAEVFSRFIVRVEFVSPGIPVSHLYRVTNTRCHIGTVFSPDDGHTVA